MSEKKSKGLREYKVNDEDQFENIRKKLEEEIKRKEEESKIEEMELWNPSEKNNRKREDQFSSTKRVVSADARKIIESKNEKKDFTTELNKLKSSILDFDMSQKMSKLKSGTNDTYEREKDKNMKLKKKNRKNKSRPQKRSKLPLRFDNKSRGFRPSKKLIRETKKIDSFPQNNDEFISSNSESKRTRFERVFTTQSVVEKKEIKEETFNLIQEKAKIVKNVSFSMQKKIIMIDKNRPLFPRKKFNDEKIKPILKKENTKFSMKGNISIIEDPGDGVTFGKDVGKNLRSKFTSKKRRYRDSIKTPRGIAIIHGNNHHQFNNIQRGALISPRGQNENDSFIGLTQANNIEVGLIGPNGRVIYSPHKNIRNKLNNKDKLSLHLNPGTLNFNLQNVKKQNNRHSVQEIYQNNPNSRNSLPPNMSLNLQNISINNFQNMSQLGSGRGGQEELVNVSFIGQNNSNNVFGINNVQINAQNPQQLVMIPQQNQIVLNQNNQQGQQRGGMFSPLRVQNVGNIGISNNSFVQGNGQNMVQQMNNNVIVMNGGGNFMVQGIVDHRGKG